MIEYRCPDCFGSGYRCPDVWVAEIYGDCEPPIAPCNSCKGSGHIFKEDNPDKPIAKAEEHRA